MTVNSYYYQRPMATNIFPKIAPNLNIKRAKRFSQNYVSDTFKTNKKGLAAIFTIIVVGLVFSMVGGSLYYQSVTSDIDYQITEAKEKLKILEIENADLKTSWAENITPNFVIDWANNNGFVKNNSVSYFDVNQAQTLSFNRAN